MRLTKTDYVLFRECPHNAWAKKWKPDVYYALPLSDFEQHLMEAGNIVEKEARKRFPDGVLIEEIGDESLSKTETLLKAGTETIFQASFSDGLLYAAVDILKQKKDGSLALYEVKASNSSKEDSDDEAELDNEGDEVVDFRDPKALEKYKKKLLKDPHVFDLAFQVYLTRKVGYKVNEAYLIRLNKHYVRAGAIDLQRLFVVEDVLPLIDEIMPSVEKEIEALREFLSSPKAPLGACSCVYKGRSKHCTTFSLHNPEIPKYGIHDLTAIGKSPKRLNELVESRIFEIMDIPDDFEFGKKIKKQVEIHKRGRAQIDVEAIQAELGTLQFPLYFLDYEAFNPAIPRFSGYRPYQQIPFQFSLHRLDSKGAELVHEEFLYTGNEDPSPLLVDALEKTIGKVGSILVWYKPFEESHVNKRLAIRLPERAEFLSSVNARMFDLMTIFSKQLHIHPDFHGSASIKKVLPVLCPELSYKELDIGNGSEAMNTWNKLVTEGAADDERVEIEKAMREYCGLDTYAMYAIWKVLDGLTR